jgi:tetraacyldisaccharide 4'-kinase
VSALRRTLLPLSWCYGAAVAARNALYDAGVFAVSSVATPVISVGNITAGGTGKTPLVEAIVEMLIRAGAKPAVLSRGYRRTSSGTVTVSDGAAVLADADEAGDEPAQIARKFPGCVVVVDEDRARGARHIETTYRPDAIVLDDGFQHRALGRDLDIVVLGGTREPLLPAGNGREHEGSLRRAGFIVLGGGLESAPARAAGKPVARMRYEIEKFSGPVAGTVVGKRQLAAGRFVAFCGIGNPGSFRATLSGHGLEPAAFLAFPDHRRYGAGDLDRIESARLRSGAQYVVTTEKDATRLAGRSMPAAPFGAALVAAVGRAVIFEGRGLLETAVLRAAGRGPA